MLIHLNVVQADIPQEAVTELVLLGPLPHGTQLRWGVAIISSSVLIHIVVTVADRKIRQLWQFSNQVRWVWWVENKC